LPPQNYKSSTRLGPKSARGMSFGGGLLHAAVKIGFVESHDLSDVIPMTPMEPTRAASRQVVVRAAAPEKI